MSTEASQPEVEVTPPQEQEEQPSQPVQQEAAPESTQDDDAAFAQGFHAAQGTDAPEPEAKPEEPSPEPQPEPAFTPEQVKEAIESVNALKQREAKLFGTIGALKQQIDALKAAPKPSQAAISLTQDKLKRLSAEFPEMAQMLAEDLSEALQGVSAPPAVAYEEIEQRINGRLEETSRAYETKLLTVMHPDWREVSAAPEFRGWVETLPEEDREQLANSWDATFIGSKLSAFKDWKSKTVQKQQTNQRRLETAVAPRGNPQKPPEPNPDEAFIQGFKQARGLS
jgi:hypothetical protein